MTAPHDLDRHLQAFLTDGPTELPDPSFDAVRDRIEATRQRTAIGPWRMPDMNKLMPVGLGAGAVVVALVVGTQLLPLGGGIGAVPSPTPSPTPQASVAPSGPPSVAPPSTPADAGLAEGPHDLWNAGVPMTVTIAAPDWHGMPGDGILAKNDLTQAPDGAGLIVFAGSGDPYVYGDPCQWSTTKPDAPATTVDELVAALATQATRDASAPVDVMVDGRAGTSITLNVPGDAVHVADPFPSCDQGYFGSWGYANETTPSRYHQDAGQIDKLWIVDVDGELVIIDAAYYPETPQAVVDELEAIVESITFE